MDLFNIDRTTYLANKVVEGFDSLIWTERFQEPGDFELRTPLVDETRALLPEDSFCGILQSNEMMIVESHEAATDDEGADILVVKGRTFDSFLEHRSISGAYKDTWAMQKQYKHYQALVGLLWTHVANTTGYDYTRPQPYGLSAREAIPNLEISYKIGGNLNTIPLQDWYLEPGPLMPQVQDFLLRSGLGLRTIQPTPGVGFDYGKLLADGTFSNFGTSNSGSNLWFQVYSGEDLSRSAVSPNKKSVIFNYEQGHIDEGRYVWSTKDVKTMARIHTAVGGVDVFAPEWADGLVAGLDRKILFIDGGDPGDQDTVSFIGGWVQKGEIELAKHRRSFVFDGEITPGNYAFGTDYYLGDKVSVLGKYGFEAKMMVSEYIRTHDSEGERGFPSLVLY